MDVLESFAQASGAVGGSPSLWPLLARSASGPPQPDGKILPVLSGSNWGRIIDP
jgi:hypothetical protein